LIRNSDVAAQKILGWLESCEDLHITVHAVDAADENMMSTFVKSFHRPIAGVMLLATVLADKSFARQTEEGFRSPFASKIDSFLTLEKVIHIDSLDWLMATTSVSGLFGNAGQSNYAR
jgi:hypothetical protein